jgi:hypothetical protein
MALPAVNVARRTSMPTRFQKGGVCGPASTLWPNTTHNDGVRWFVIARTTHAVSTLMSTLILRPTAPAFWANVRCIAAALGDVPA